MDPTSRTRRQEKNSMDTSRTKSVERPVRAVDLFIASLDALTLLEGSSTLSARIDSDERATLLASFGRPAGLQNERMEEKEGDRERKRKTSAIEREKEKGLLLSQRMSPRKEAREDKLIGSQVDSSNIFAQSQIKRAEKSYQRRKSEISNLSSSILYLMPETRC